jgi:hypothetical protein
MTENAEPEKPKEVKPKNQDPDFQKEIDWAREEIDVGLIEHSKRLDAMMENALIGQYTPLKIDNNYGTVWDNFRAYKVANRIYDISNKKITPEFLTDFAEKTHEKLYIHPIFLLWVLENQLSEETKLLKNDKDMAEMVQEAEYLIKLIPNAMKKVSRPREIYV